ncbi:hypothetical protein HYV86_04560 [Candidatus Woesearchaeota archaeon]|nr:hypothetical protein [Candidatus Woesearchaeota archaeon]
MADYQSLDQFIRPPHSNSDEERIKIVGGGIEFYVPRGDVEVAVMNDSDSSLWHALTHDVGVKTKMMGSEPKMDDLPFNRVSAGQSFAFPPGHVGLVVVPAGSISVYLQNGMYDRSAGENGLIVTHDGNNDADYLAQHGYRRRQIMDLTDQVKTYQVPDGQEVTPEELWRFGLGLHHHPVNPHRTSEQYPQGTPITERYMALSSEGFYWGFEAVEGNTEFEPGTRFAGHVPQYHVLTVPCNMWHVVSPMPGLKFVGITSDPFSKTKEGAPRKDDATWFYDLRDELMDVQRR